MSPHSLPDSTIGDSRLPFRFSRTLLGLLLATILLAGLLTFSTIANINRAETHMYDFLIEKGESIIHVLEAGSKMSVLHHMGQGNPLHTLLDESCREEDIIFIRLSDSSGAILDEAGLPSPHTLSATETRTLLATPVTTSRLDEHRQTLIVSRAFNVSSHGHDNAGHAATAGQVISIGLLTRDFETARRQDTQHNLFMGAILFLVGSAGLYFLFLYQGMRVARATLANMKLYTDSIIESIPVCLVSLAPDGRIVSSNRNIEELFGMSQQDLHGRQIAELLPHCSQCSQDLCSSAVEQPLEFKNAHGEVVPIRLSCSSLVNHEGQPIGRVLVIRDMSSIRDMELQLERSRRLAALGKMATGIAHEIRNPLGTLRGFAQFFGSQASTLTEKQYAELMVSEVDRLNQTVSGLLQFARPRQPEWRQVELAGLFSRLEMLMQPDFAAAKVRFRQHCDTTADLTADPDLLLQVLMNLLRNSITASAPGNDIQLTATDDGHTLRITVTDHGRGMSDKERDQMFDPFFTTTKSGTGLGLAVSHQIIEQHNGSFEVRTAPGQGTSISIILPLTQTGR